MSNFEKMKFRIGNDPELSKRVQEALFAIGASWITAGARVSFTERYALYLSDNMEITFGDKEYFNDNKDYVEADIDWMRTKKPEYIELNGKKYIKTELEEALSKINPVEE